jgi:hypothetical protein
MKISKLLPVLCALAVGANSLTVRAEDNPDQAAARIALAKKLFEMGEQQPPATNAVATKPAVAPKIKPAPATDDGVVMTPVNQPATKDGKAKAKAEKAAAAAKAKQEADQAAADLKAKKAADKRLAEQQSADAKAAKAQAEAKAKKEADQAAADLKAKKEADKKLAEQQATDARNAKAQAAAKAKADKVAVETTASQEAQKRAALAQTKANNTAPEAQPVAKANKEKKQKPAPAVVTAPPPVKTADANYAGKDLGMKPIAPPALRIAPSKESRLQALLEKYKADQITPEEYHQQRKAILDEP